MPDGSLRIVHLLQKPQHRGAEIFASHLARRLEDEGHALEALYLYPAARPSARLARTGSLLAGSEGHVTERFPGINPRLLGSLSRRLKALRPDVVLANGARTVKYGSAVKRLSGRPRPWRLVYRNIDVPSFWNPARWRQVLYAHLVMSEVDGAVGCSARSLDDASRVYDLKIPRRVILNAIDPAHVEFTGSRDTFRRRLGVEHEDPVVLFLGSLVRQKRPDRFVRVFAEVARAHPRARAWIVGDGPLREQVEALVSRSGLGDRIRLLGAQERVGGFLHCADLLVGTSDSEGLPAVVIEAAYVGLPVVYSDVGGVSECVLDGETGLLAPPGDERSLVVAVSRLLGEPELRRRLSERAKTEARSRFTIDIVAREYLNFYRELLASPEARPIDYPNGRRNGEAAS